MRGGGSLQSLLSQLEGVPSPILEGWNRSGGLEIPGLISLISSPRDTTVISPEGPESPPGILSPSTPFLEEGYHSLSTGGTSLTILHDGSSQVLRRLVEESYPVKHVWVITPQSRMGEVGEVLRGLREVEIFSSYELPSLSPTYELVYHEGVPLTYPGSGGDTYGVLSEGGTLEEFNERGGKYILFTTTSAPPTPLLPLVAGHLSSHTSITSVVGERIRDFPLLTREGLVEGESIQGEFSPSTSGWGTYVLPSTLTNGEVPWVWRRVRRVVDGKLTLEFHRDLSQLTRILPTGYTTPPQNIPNNSCG